MILNSLPPSYETLVTALKSRPEKLKISFINGRLLKEYRKRKKKTLEDSSNETVVKVSNSKFNSGQKTNCFFCDKPGHQKKDCKQYIKWKAKKEKETNNLSSGNVTNICFMTNEEEGSR